MHRFREIRKELGLSQQELANQLGVNQTAISQWERGATTPTSALLLKFARIANCNPEYLLGSTDIKKTLTLQEVSELKEAQELRIIMERMTPEARQNLLQYGRFLATEHKKAEQK